MKHCNECVTPLSRRRSIQSCRSESICILNVFWRQISHNTAMHNCLVSLTCGASILLSACSEPVATLGSHAEPLVVPFRGEVTAPRLAGGDNGNLILSWLAPEEDGTALQFSRYYQNQWSPLTTVVEKIHMFVNWADLPSVVPLGGQRLAAHWLVKRPGDVYTYDIAFAQSTNNGYSWTEPVAPHDDGTPTEHGFVSIFPYQDEAGLIWLDGRETANDRDADDATVIGMALRSGFIDSAQAIDGEQLVDDLICDCCQTDVAITSSGPVAVYRNRTVDEIRDISVARLLNGVWQPGGSIAADNWLIAACPVNGPAIVAGGSFVAVAWFTGADKPTVRVSTSTDSGESFADPSNVVEGDTLGRVGLALLDSGHVAVSWLRGVSNESNEVLVRHVARDGSIGPIVTIAVGAAALTVPQMVRLEDKLIFAWTESQNGEYRIASATVPIDALYAVP